MNENKMGVMPVGKLLVSMSAPIMISMLVQALYNIVDSVFVAKISEDALTALSVAFPIQNLMIAISTGIGVGMNALLSRSLGEKNMEMVDKSAVHGLMIELICFVLFLIFGIFFVPGYVKMQTNIAGIYNAAVPYIKICCIFSFGIFLQITFERMLQSTGKTIYSMVSQLCGAVVNIILDPIMIFGLLGCPQMGVAGAAYATVIGQIFAAVIGYILNKHFNKEIKIHKRDVKPDIKIFKIILAVGIPSAVMASIGSVMTFGINKILMAMTPTAVAVFGVYFKLQSFVFMPVFGLNNGMIPIIAYNYGARKKDRILKTAKLSLIMAIVIMTLGLIVFHIASKDLLLLFNASGKMLSIGIPALKIISTSFIFAGYCIMCSSVFQAFGNGLFSMIVSIGRQLVILLPAAYLLSLTGNVNLVWFSFPIAETANVLMCTLLLKKTYKLYLEEI